MTRKRAQVLCGITLVLAVLGLFSIFGWAVLATWHVDSWDKHGFGNMAFLAIPWTIIFGLLTLGFFGWQATLKIEEKNAKKEEQQRRLIDIEIEERAAKVQITRAEAFERQLAVAKKAEAVGLTQPALEAAANTALKQARKDEYFKARREWKKQLDAYNRYGHAFGSYPQEPLPQDYGLSPADVQTTTSVKPLGA